VIGFRVPECAETEVQRETLERWFRSHRRAHIEWHLVAHILQFASNAVRSWVPRSGLPACWVTGPGQMVRCEEHTPVPDLVDPFLGIRCQYAMVMVPARLWRCKTCHAPLSECQNGHARVDVYRVQPTEPQRRHARCGICGRPLCESCAAREFTILSGFYGCPPCVGRRARTMEDRLEALARGNRLQ